MPSDTPLTQWWAAIMTAGFGEVFVFDAHTLQCLDASDCAVENLGIDRTHITDLALADLFVELDSEEVRQLLLPLYRQEVDRVNVRLWCQRRDGSSYPLGLQIVYADSGSIPCYIAIGRGVSESVDKYFLQTILSILR